MRGSCRYVVAKPRLRPTPWQQLKRHPLIFQQTQKVFNFGQSDENWTVLKNERSDFLRLFLARHLLKQKV